MCRHPKINLMNDRIISDILKQAEIYLDNSEFTLARRCYENILLENQHHEEALNNLGVLLFQEGEVDAAIARFRKVLRNNASNIDAIANLSFAQAFQQESLSITSHTPSLLNVGFISVWFERGQSYVTKMIRDAVAEKHNTFVFARTGHACEMPMLETTGQWSVPNLSIWPHYDIPVNVIDEWIKDNNLDVVVFNEEYDWELVKAAKRTRAKVFTYLDFYKDDWRADMGLFDSVLCSTKRTYHMVKAFCAAQYIGWGVDTDLFRPAIHDPEYTFFHNAGWLGNNYRKMTPAVIAAFDSISRLSPDFSLFVHSQVKLEMLPSIIIDIVKNNPRIIFHVETLPAPGLYHKGKIMLFPTKLEGLGLPLFEGLSCGMPVITTNAPPMNEFVRDNHTGLLVDLAFRTTREDNVAFPEEIIDMMDLSRKMARLASDDKLLRTMSKNARRYAEEELRFSLLADRILSNFAEVKVSDTLMYGE